jgi:hypothetical protein
VPLGNGRDSELFKLFNKLFGDLKYAKKMFPTGGLDCILHTWML